MNKAFHLPVVVRSLMSVSAFALITGLPASLMAQSTERPVFVENAPNIVVRDDINLDLPPPSGALDNRTNITGIGQMVVDAGDGSVGLCTGTLINPRTVVFAAHCVNEIPAEAYGAAAGGTPISFGFRSDNLPAARRWLGLDGGTLHATDARYAIYNAEHIWYDPRSLELGDGLNFLQGDVAIATLDTPASKIPTWTLLFSPLTAETHGVQTGYGTRGNGTDGANLGIDFRRRTVENMISVLGSLDERDAILFGPAAPFLVQSLYQLDFDSPAGEDAFDGVTNFDFDLFDGKALPREGTTAGGDSGGPLIVDQLFDKPVVVGTLSGGSRFFAEQPRSGYGSSDFYQPLFLFWDQIVANNPYVYATNRAGQANWTDSNHWVQQMDPNYAISVGGKLVNALPGKAALGVSGDTNTFGSVCFQADCFDLSQLSVTRGQGTPNSVFVPGGPGSRDFVPNNRISNVALGIRPRYYDVTLAAQGMTWVQSSVTIDRLTVDGPTKLDVRKPGALTVLGDYTQLTGWTNVDGLFKTGEAFVGGGILSGSGTIDPTFLTVGRALVAPGGADIGTLTVRGDVILSSGSSLAIELNRQNADQLAVIGDADNRGAISVGGLVLLNRGSGAAPRQGQVFDIVTARGGVTGTFSGAFAALGVLQPVLSYGADIVSVKLKAGKFSDFLGKSDATVSAFAGALDALRANNYNNLYSLYGMIDILDPAQLAGTLRGLSPTVVGEAASMTRQQDGVMIGLVSNRLSLLGSERAPRGSFMILGAPDILARNLGAAPVSGSSAAQISFARQLTPSGQTIGMLPETMSGFMSGGYDYGSTSLADANPGVRGGRRSWHFAMGLEAEVDPRLIIGSAIGFVDGSSDVQGSRAQTQTSQAAVYGTYLLGHGAYAAGLASIANSRIGVQRSTDGGIDGYSLRGATSALSYSTHAELGWNLPLTKGVTFTPRAALRYSALFIDRLRETGGERAFDISNVNQNRLEGRVGAQLAGSLPLGAGWSMTPNLQADFVNRIAGNSGSMTLRFAAADSEAFALPFGSQDNRWAEMKGGLKVANGPLSFGASFESEIGRADFRDNRAVAELAVRF